MFLWGYVTEDRYLKLLMDTPFPPPPTTWNSSWAYADAFLGNQEAIVN